MVKIICEKCGKEISKCNFEKHYKACTGPKESYKLNHDGLICQFCGKECKNKNSLCNHERLCKENPNKQDVNSYTHTSRWYEVMHSLSTIRTKQIKNDYTCRFCDSVYNTTKSGISLHEKYCNMNPNRVNHPNKGISLSEESKQRMRDNPNTGGLRKGAGRGIKGYYKGLYCMSTWELAWVVYQLEHGNTPIQCKEKFSYVLNDKEHYYTPDFILNGIYYEIKNWHRPDTDAKIKQFPTDKVLILIEGQEQNSLYLNYVINKYGEKFWEILYENYKKEEKILSDFQVQKQKRNEELLNLLQNSGIDFSKYGWKKQVFDLTGHRGSFIEKNLPDFYSTCYHTSKKVKKASSSMGRAPV